MRINSSLRLSLLVSFVLPLAASIVLAADGQPNADSKKTSPTCKAMASDLLNFAIAEEYYFANYDKYTADIAELRKPFNLPRHMAEIMPNASKTFQVSMDPDTIIQALDVTEDGYVLMASGKDCDIKYIYDSKKRPSLFEVSASYVWKKGS